MDPRFYVIREERRRVIVKRHPQLHEDPVRVLVMEPSAENFPMNMDVEEEYHRRPPNFFSMRSDDTSYGGSWPTMNVMKDGHGKQLPVLEAPHNVNVHAYQRPPVATQVQYQQPIAQNQQASLYQQASQAPNPVKMPAPGKVIDYNEAARIYGGVVIKDGQVPPPMKNPAPGKVLDHNEAARIYGGVVIKNFGWNDKLPRVRAF